MILRECCEIGESEMLIEVLIEVRRSIGKDRIDEARLPMQFGPTTGKLHLLDLGNTLFPPCIDLIYDLLLNRSHCHRTESRCHFL